LSLLPQLGANAAGALASNIGGIQQNIGDIRASGTAGRTNALGGALGFGGDLASTFLNRNNTSLAQPTSFVPGNQNFVGPPDPFIQGNPGFVGPPVPRI